MVTQVTPVLLGELSGGTQSNVLWCSSDGTIAFGWSDDINGQLNAVTWNPVGTAPQSLGTLNPLLFGQCNVCGLDGSLSGGGIGIQYEGGPAVPFNAFIWSGLSPVNLGIPPGYYGGSIVHSVSAPTANTGWLWQGSTAGDQSGINVAAVWVSGAWIELGIPGGLTDIKTVRMARGLTDTVVGNSYNRNASGSPPSPVLWQGATATVLPLPSPATASGEAQLITDNGTLAIGTAKDASNNEYTVAWNLTGSPAATIMNGNGGPSAGFVPAYVTPSGGLILGNAFPAMGFTGAAYWTSPSGAPTFLPALAGSALVYPIFYPRGLAQPAYSNILASDNGRVVTGFSDDGTNAYPVVWVSNSLTYQLLMLPGVSYDSGDYTLIGATFVSNDGSTIFGSVVDNTDAARAVYWPLAAPPPPPPPPPIVGVVTVGVTVPRFPKG